MDDALRQLFKNIEQKIDLRFGELQRAAVRYEQALLELKESLSVERESIQSLKTNQALVEAKVEEFEKDMNGAFQSFRKELESRREYWKYILSALPGLIAVLLVWMLK